jgi:hypothetical protein
MDLDKIFSMFNTSPEPTENPYINNLELLKDHPAFYLGMFHKLINREDEITLQIIVENLDVDEETRGNITRMSEFLTFTQAYSYLSTINLSEHSDYLLTYNNPELKKALKKALQYFIKIEEYEKCSFIKKVIDSSPFS